jgi:hypothetical protein
VRGDDRKNNPARPSDALDSSRTALRIDLPNGVVIHEESRQAANWRYSELTFPISPSWHLPQPTGESVSSLSVLIPASTGEPRSTEDAETRVVAGRINSCQS